MMRYFLYPNSKILALDSWFLTLDSNFNSQNG